MFQKLNNFISICQIIKPPKMEGIFVKQLKDCLEKNTKRMKFLFYLLKTDVDI